MAFKKPKREVDRIFLHCSASDNPSHDDVSVMRDWHVNGRGWSDVGYHFFIQKNGNLQPGRPLAKTPAAQKGNNRGTIAVCLHGLAEEKFTKAQYRTLIGLCNEIDGAYGGMLTFHGHREVSTKSCPVFPYRKVLGLDDHGEMSFQQTVSPSFAPAVPAGDADESDLPTLRLMARGAKVVLLQNRLSAAGFEVEEDGIFGQATFSAVTELQMRNGLRPDGIVGPRTWAVLAP